MYVNQIVVLVPIVIDKFISVMIYCSTKKAENGM